MARIEDTDGLRVTDGTPEIIQKAFKYPYIHFSENYPFSYPLTNKPKCLDIASGNASHHDILSKVFDVTHADGECIDNPLVQHVDITKTLPYENEEFDTVFCFETIEHLPKEKHYDVITELLRVVKQGGNVIISSVSADGIDYLGDVEIFKAKNGKNPHHLSEMTMYEFQNTFVNYQHATNDILINYFYLLEKNEDFYVMSGLYKGYNLISNIAWIEKN